MIMKTLKDVELKISALWDKNPLINPDKSYIVYRLTQIFGVVRICTEGLYSWVSIISRQNVLLKLLNIHSNNTTESYRKHRSGSERSEQLSRRKNRTTILWIDCTIRFSLSFWVEVRLTSKCIRFCSKAAGAESDNHIKSGQESRPLSLSPGQNPCSTKIFQVFVVCDNINWNFSAFKVVSLSLERLIDCHEFLVMCVIVEFGVRESPR
jgi:hypothetical protein